MRRTNPRWAHVLSCLIALGCGDDAERADASDALDAEAPIDAADAVDGRVPDATLPDAALGDDAGDDAGGGPGALVLEVPAEPPVDLPFVVSVTTADGSPLSTTAVLIVDGDPVGELTLYRGRGSAPLSVVRAGAVRLQVEAAEARGERMVTASARPRQTVSGALGGAEVVWGTDAELLVEGDVEVPAGTALVIEAGARVLLERNASLQVAGTLRVQGSAESPVLFTRAGEDPWGGIAVLEGGVAELDHAWLTAGGGDASRVFGHSDSQALIHVDHGTLVMRGGGVADNPGKAFASQTSKVTLTGVLVTRCDTGGEMRASEVLVEHGHVLEMPDGDRSADDDDNDGIYMSNPPHDADGNPIESIIRDTVFAVGEDDAIDHNGAQLRVERVWIEDFRHEGIAASDTNRIMVVDSVVRGCDNGIEVGYGTPEVIVEHCTLTDNDVGLKFGDTYDRAENGSLTVHHTISIGNHEANVRNHVVALDGPLEGAIELDCSMVDDAEHDGLNGNVAGQPQGDWVTRGCASAPALTGAGCDATPPGPRACF
jgi:hypothetical protein